MTTKKAKPRKPVIKDERPSPTCIGCAKKPAEIDEYVEMGADEGLTPDEFVRLEEGTYNLFEHNKFYCTKCYVAAGMPTAPKYKWRV